MGRLVRVRAREGELLPRLEGGCEEIRGRPQVPGTQPTSFFPWAIIDGALQTNVLACGRVDVPVLLDAQKLWLRRQTAPRFLDMLPCPLECFVSETEPPVDPDKPATGEDIDRSFEWAWKCHGAWCEAMVYAAETPEPPRRLGIGDDGDSGAADRLPQQRRTPGYFGALSELSTGIIHWYDVNGRATNSAPRVVYTTPTSIDMHFSVRIPDELLVGPWDWAKAKLLFWLVRQGTRLAREEQTWEVGVPSQSDDAIELTRWYS